MSDIAQQVSRLLDGANSDDIQDLLEDAMDRIRGSLPAMMTRRAEMEDGSPEALEMDDAISRIEEMVARFDKARADAIAAVRAEP